MTRWIDVFTEKHDAPLVRARWCVSFRCRLAGLMFCRSLAPGRGLLLVQTRASRADSAIHMLFVFFPIGVVWLDEERRVVDRKLARPWRLYWPGQGASYILEGDPGLVECLAIGEKVVFRDV
jgi:uncharacterized membrane protein (UPF0127 family)